jgi:hypothetical protein
LPPSDAPESDSLAIVDVTTPAAAKLTGFVRTGISPSGVVAAADRVFVSNAGDDSVVEVDAATRTVVNRLTITIPGLEQLRGVIPLGMAYEETSGRLLVAEAGINAVGVIDTRQKRVLGHIPTAWYPDRVVINDGVAVVANEKGHGIGADSATGYSLRGSLLPSQLYQGTLSIFPLPAAEELAALTATVMRANGFAPQHPVPPSAPVGVRHVVLIVKERRSYDEILGGLEGASNGHAMGDAEIQHEGRACNSQPSSHRPPMGFQRQLLCRFIRPHRRPPLADGGLSQRLDRKFDAGGIWRHEGFQSRRRAGTAFVPRFGDVGSTGRRECGRNAVEPSGNAGNFVLQLRRRARSAGGAGPVRYRYADARRAILADLA